jgi:hypothetical protein
MKDIAFALAVFLFANFLARAIIDAPPVIAATAKLSPQQVEQAREQAHAKQRADRFHWYPLSAKQAEQLRAALAAVPAADRKPTWVLCDSGVGDCRELAQDLTLALEAAGWDATIERPGGIADGMRATCLALLKAVIGATGIPVTLDPPDDDEHCAINVGRKGGAKR